MRQVGFHQMADGTRADYELLDRSERDHARGLAEHILAALRKLDHTLAGYPVSRLGHSLQAATRALRDRADDELVLAALVHDVGDELAPYNHAEIAAGILRPYVRPEVTWIVEQHGLFQNYYYVQSPGRRSSRARPSSRASVVSGLRAVLRPLGPVFLRPALSLGTVVDLRTPGAADILAPAA